MTYGTTTQPQTQPAKRGCFFWGCIISIILFVCFLIVMAVLAFLGKKVFDIGMSYLAEEPAEIAIYEPTPDEAEAVQDKFRSVREGVKARKGERYSFSVDELNALIATDPEFKELRGRAYLTIEDDRITTDTSIPLGGLTGIQLFKGRYINGKVQLEITATNGRLQVFLQEIEVNGKKVPEQFMAAISKENIAKELAKDSDFQNAMRNIERIDVSDGKIVIQAKKGEP